MTKRLIHLNASFLRKYITFFPIFCKLFYCRCYIKYCKIFQLNKLHMFDALINKLNVRLTNYLLFFHKSLKSLCCTHMCYSDLIILRLQNNVALNDLYIQKT
jgi:hypothetical protein